MSEDMNTNLTLDRAELLKAAGAGVLVVSFAAPLVELADAATERAAGPWPDVSTRSLDSWIAVNADGTATLFSGKNDNGQGVETAFRQIVAEELDMDLEQVRAVVGDSSRTLDQGGASARRRSRTAPSRCATRRPRVVACSSSSPRRGSACPASRAHRREGRRQLVEPTARGGRATASCSATRSSTSRSRATTRSATTSRPSGVAKPKDPATYKLVGKSIQRPEIARKVYGRQCLARRHPRARHGARPRRAAEGRRREGGRASTASRSASRRSSACCRWGRDAVAVFAEREEDAINAAKTLRVKWSNPATPPFSTHETVYDYIRQARPRFDRIVTNTGDIGKALGAAAKVIEAEYLWPFQSHASMAPGLRGSPTTARTARSPCGAARRRRTACSGAWPSCSGWHVERQGPRDLVQGPGSYGRNDADDAALEAAWLSKQIRKPVRLQWMRHEGTAWDPKGPATIIKMRGGLDAAGKVVAVDYDWKGFSGQEVGTSGEQAADTLIGMSIGLRPAPAEHRRRAGGPLRVREQARCGSRWSRRSCR